MPRKKVRNRLFVVFFFLSSFLLCRCTDDRSNYLCSLKIDSNKYIEIYEPFNGGVFAGSFCSYFYTDSNQVSVFIGRADDNSGYDFYIIENIVIALEYEEIFISMKKSRKKVYVGITAIDSKGNILD